MLTHDEIKDLLTRGSAQCPNCSSSALQVRVESYLARRISVGCKKCTINLTFDSTTTHRHVLKLLRRTGWIKESMLPVPGKHTQWVHAVVECPECGQPSAAATADGGPCLSCTFAAREAGTEAPSLAQRRAKAERRLDEQDGKLVAYEGQLRDLVSRTEATETATGRLDEDVATLSKGVKQTLRTATVLVERLNATEEDLARLLNALGGLDAERIEQLIKRLAPLAEEQEDATSGGAGRRRCGKDRERTTVPFRLPAPRREPCARSRFVVSPTGKVHRIANYVGYTSGGWRVDTACGVAFESWEPAVELCDEASADVRCGNCFRDRRVDKS